VEADVHVCVLSYVIYISQRAVRVDDHPVPIDGTERGGWWTLHWWCLVVKYLTAHNDTLVYNTECVQHLRQSYHWCYRSHVYNGLVDETNVLPYSTLLYSILSRLMWCHIPVLHRLIDFYPSVFSWDASYLCCQRGWHWCVLVTVGGGCRSEQGRQSEYFHIWMRAKCLFHI
jgi:hypothetical protein